LKSELNLTIDEINHLFSPRCVREQAKKIFLAAEAGETHFKFHPEKLASVVDLVLAVIRRNYPDLNIPFHSRWGHFKVGEIDRTRDFFARIGDLDSLERARSKIDLVVTSVLLDAGAGSKWKYFEQSSSRGFGRSEGLAVASYHLFMSGAMATDGRTLRADAEGLRNLNIKTLNHAFQVSAENPLVGIEGRLALLNNLAEAVSNKEFFPGSRPGSLVDYLKTRYGLYITGPLLLRAVIDGFGSIWPGRLIAGGRNLGDVWLYKGALVPFHKLSQWLTYSLIEPLQDAGFQVKDVNQLTGLAEYRNGGLILDSGLVTLRNQADSRKKWRPDSELIIEWRALTIHVLDLIAEGVRKSLGRNPEEFPLAKVLEGGTWWAGRRLASELRSDGSPPLEIESDGTVF